MTESGPLYESILNSVKKNLGIMEDVTAFDPDLVLLINSTFAKLHQMGVGPEETFEIEDSSNTWDEFYTNKDIALVKGYIYMEVRLIFDPPTASVLTSLEKKIAEYEWRLNVADDEPIFRSNQNGNESDL